MKKLTIFSLISLAIGFSSLAQHQAFTVILNKGNNTFGRESETKSLILGEILKSSDKITVVPDGYVALLHDQSGLCVELKEKGAYTVSELEQTLADQSNSVLSKYGKFLMSKINPEGTGNQNLNVTGAVERGETEYINLYLPKITDVYGDELLIAWQQVDEVKDYVLTIKNHKDEIVARKEVPGNKYKLSFREAPFKGMKLMSINVSANSAGEFVSKDYGINRISAEQKHGIEEEYKNLIEVADAENVLDKLLIASFFEENELLGDAISYYDQALALSPDANGFGRLYNNFLYRNNLK
jgi:hypothetical protein